ncbi:hypothetical protein E1263_24620 [Kribbella antibiotica]|uniref:Uncharacterized protein n=1 Tax=Kribbella antibiotica TaxID=190195 RepID=A0A4R4ZFE9_9ACTN|nr:hypothetical protein [Kribbella antibiotica]TDD57105.1 hypothetical protein E1263_24620 [Kribbella antibiotica]
MSQLRRIAGECPDNKTCPAAWTTDADPDSVYVVGSIVEDDQDLLAKAGPGETVVRFPRSLWERR